MGHIEDDDIRRVREATDLVQLVAETVAVSYTHLTLPTICSV